VPPDVTVPVISAKVAPQTLNETTPVQPKFESFAYVTALALTPVVDVYTFTASATDLAETLLLISILAVPLDVVSVKSS
jgi:hypothetical protein